MWHFWGERLRIRGPLKLEELANYANYTIILEQVKRLSDDKDLDNYPLQAIPRVLKREHMTGWLESGHSKID